MEIYLSLGIAIVGGVASLITIWSKLKEKIIKMETRVSYLEQELKDHRSRSESAIDQLRSEVGQKIENLTKEFHTLSNTIERLLGKLEGNNK